mmetsp:Transcript_62478/g.167902  ORF Transcript_62478/g.167902 Transcript_62478/m.167902 type:complete len:228 (-) Transcript_62478:305-988(-)
MQLPTVTEVMAVFLSLASAFSTFTRTYSLAEYYYVQTLKGVDNFMARSDTVVNVDMLDTGDHQFKSQSSAASMSSVGTIHKDRAALTAQVEEAFASFNEMRMSARNSMRLSLMCLVAAAMTKVDTFTGLMAIPSHSEVPVCFACMFAGLAGAWFVGFRSRDIKAHMTISLLGCAMGSVGAHLDRPGLETGKIMAFIILLASIVIVPRTVRSFRMTYLKMAKQYARIF